MNWEKLMRQAQKAQTELQEKLAQWEVVGSAGGGLVTITLNGLKELRRVHIEPQALSEQDPQLLQDLIHAAWEEAARQVEMEAKGLLSRLGLPGGLF